MAMTAEQKKALDELFAVVQAHRDAAAQPAVVPQDWLDGLRPTLQSWLNELLQSKDKVESTILDAVERHPLLHPLLVK